MAVKTHPGGCACGSADRRLASPWVNSQHYTEHVFCNPSTQEVETGGSEVQGLGLHKPLVLFFFLRKKRKENLKTHLNWVPTSVTPEL